MGAGGLVRVRLDLAYDGTDFAGWARQPGLRTVQGDVEAALERVLRTPVSTTVAGRTDAGVHALGQVAHADVPAELWAGLGSTLLRRLAGVLAGDVRVTALAAAPPGFDARFGALSRRYAYRIADTAWGTLPLRRFDTLAHHRPLDVDAMRAAVPGLLGEHDFAAYCRPRAGATTIRRLTRLDLDRDADSVLVAAVEADAFCHSMVRALVGALLAVGEGRKPPQWPAHVLSAGVRDPAVAVAPARGLTLVAVTYPPDDELAVRVATTRRQRLPAVPGPEAAASGPQTP